MNRGSIGPPIALPAPPPPSMRPRFMNRGSLPVPARYPLCRATFNEAPIHESGKYHDLRKTQGEAAHLQ